MYELIQRVAMGVSAAPGQTYFPSLVKSLAQLVEADYAFIGELTKGHRQTIKTLAVFSQGELISNFEYNLSYRASERIIGQSSRCNLFGVRELFPHDPILAKFESESFTGLPLLDSQESCLGLVAVANRKPFHDPSLVESILQIFGTHAAAELERIQAQNALQATEERLRNVTNHAPVILWATDAEGVITFSEGKGLSAIGLRPGQLVGASVFDLYHDSPKWIAYNRRALNGEAFTTTEEFDGAVLETQWTPMFDGEGKVTGLTGVSTDVTARQRATEKLQLSEDRFRSMVQNSSDIITLLGEEGTVLYQSPAVVHILGYQPDEMQGHCAFDYLHPNDRSRVEHEFAELLEQGSKDLIDFRFRHANGNWVWLEVAGTNLLQDPTVRAVVAHSRDVTQRKLFEVALQESEERFSAFMDNSPTLAFIKDEEGQYIYFNKATEQKFQAPLSELKGKTNYTRLAPEVAHQLRANDLQVLASNQPLQFVETIPTPDGHLRDWLTFKFPLKDANGRRLVGGVAIDITEQKQAENALRESEQNLQALFSNAVDAILLADDNAGFVDANLAACTLLGYNREELLSLKLPDIATESERVASLGLWRRFLDMGQMQGESKVLRKEEGTCDVEWRAVANIRPGLHLIMMHDISERKRSLEALERSQAQLAEAQKVAHIGSWDWDLKTDHIQCSEELLNIFGATAKEFGDSLASALTLLHPDDRDRVRDDCEKSVRSGEDYQSYYRVVHPNGNIRLVYARGIVAKDMYGNSVRLLGTAQDITERKQIENALQESESRFRRLSEANIIGIIISDLQGHIVEANPIFLRLVGYSPEELQSGMVRWNTMTPPSHQRRAQRAISQLRREGAAIPWQQEFICKEGERVPVLMGAVLLEGSQERFIAFIIDLTAQKEAETSLLAASKELAESHKQLRALAAHLESLQEEARSRIAREIHDELGQSLTGLKMDLSWLTRRLLPGSDQNPAELQEHIAEMSNLIDNTIQSVRRICAELRPRILDDLGLEAAAEWQAQEFQKRTGIRCRLVSRLRTTLIHTTLEREISTAVFRILQEALTNVTRHANASQVTITLRHKADALVMTVKDDGQGFDPGAVLTKNTLGLLGIQERALILGGKVEVKSAENKGTTIVLHIPLNQIARQEIDWKRMAVIHPATKQ